MTAPDPPRASRRPAGHLVSWLDAGVADTALAEPSPGAPAASLDVGDRVGRYVVLGVLGAGAMGAVHAAYDPDLDRKVALKLLVRPAGSTADDHARLRGEAQALARISHPNVVLVHDVGTWDDQVYVAMEHIAGGTLRGWLAAERRSWREIVDVIAAAGRGLAAAHAAGLVHRDVKPDNILVDRTGRARIGDFGLALAADQAVAGTTAGTPAYMAPEQLTGQVVTPRADQFALCVTLYEALYGVRPFAGNTVGAIAAAIRTGRIAEPPADRRVPGWLRAAVVRGLAHVPADRHASVDALVAAITHAPGRPRTWWALAGTVAIAGAVVALITVGDRGDPCGGAAGELVGVWDPTRAAAAGAGFAPSEWPLVAARLDHYAASWTAAHRRACEATRVRAVETEDALSLRMECLTDRKRRLGALVDALARPEPGTAAQAITAASALAPLSLCDDVAALRQVVRPPADPAIRAKVASVRGEIAQASALSGLARIDQAQARAAEAVAAARATGYAPAIADALIMLGQVQDAGGKYREANATLREAAIAADAAGDDRTRFVAWNTLTQNVAILAGPTPEITALMARTEAVLARTSRDPELELGWMQTRAIVALYGGNVREAITGFHALVAAAERELGPDDPALAEALGGLAAALQRGDDRDRAELDAVSRRIEEVRASAYGAGHAVAAAAQLDAAQARAMRAVILLDQDKPAEAADLLEATIAQAIRANGGEDHQTIALLIDALGMAYHALARLPDAHRELARGLAIRRRLLAPDDLEIASSLHNLGRVRHDEGDFAAALAGFAEARGIYQRALGADSVRVGAIELSTARSQHALGRLGEALTSVRGALERGKGAAFWAAALALDGEILLAQGKPAPAVPRLAHALELRKAQAWDKAGAGHTELVLARALRAIGKSADARRHAAAAAVTLAAAGKDTEAAEAEALSR